MDGATRRGGWQPVTVRQGGESRVSIATGGGAIELGDIIVALGAHLLHDDQAVAPLTKAAGTQR